MKTVKLFVDCIVPDGKKSAPANSHKIVNYLSQNLKTINTALIVEIIPIRSAQDIKVLVDNGVSKLPTILDDTKYVVGIDSITAFINKHINGVRSKTPKDDEDILRDEQMAEMDMEKYEAGEYDDDEGEDDIFVKGDKDARKENIQQKMAQFNSRRKGRIEETKPAKRGSKKKKTTNKQRNVEEDNEPDNIEVEPKPSTDIKLEDWDPETQQLLDKAGN